ncbi:hypothetical protein GGF46_005518 [Coemansia sp. RSA 552]|nr:hypothetical protein GGF46_005518 [Coemansia sp. RSA 552]
MEGNEPLSSLAALEARQTISRPLGGAAASGEDKWRRLGARVLPLFAGERMQGSVEESNEVVRSCLRSSESMDGVWPEIHGILRMGMASLVRALYRHVGVPPRYDTGVVAVPSAALLGEAARGDAIVVGLVRVWDLLIAHVLPYVEAVFLPLVQFGLARRSVRSAVLAHFRDAVVVPLLPVLDDAVRLARVGLLPAGTLPPTVNMLTVLAALTPTDRGLLYTTARALSSALQA